MPNQENIQRAVFKIQGSNTEIPVHFNPQSLQYTIKNNLKNKGRGNRKKQYVSDSTGKLKMELVFDTTGSGEDVRLHTVKVAKFMEPKSDKTPPVVIFEWGLYTFKGMVEDYKETIDFFSAYGIPLRASTNLTMSNQDAVFEGGSSARRAATGGSLDSETDSIPAYARPGKGAADVATKGGNPRAARNVAESNNIENMRFPGTASLEISGSVSLKTPVAFASGGAGISAGAGISLGIDAGVSGKVGAFAGLHAETKATSTSAKLNLDNFIDEEVTGTAGTDDQTSFRLGGQAGLQGSASLKADVGTAGELNARIEFDGG